MKWVLQVTFTSLVEVPRWRWHTAGPRSPLVSPLVQWSSVSRQSICQLVSLIRVLQELPDGKPVTSDQLDSRCRSPGISSKRSSNRSDRSEIIPAAWPHVRECAASPPETPTVRGTKSSVETATREEEEGSDSGRRGARARSDRK